MGAFMRNQSIKKSKLLRMEIWTFFMQFDIHGQN